MCLRGLRGAVRHNTAKIPLTKPISVLLPPTRYPIDRVGIFYALSVMTGISVVITGRFFCICMVYCEQQQGCIQARRILMRKRTRQIIGLLSSCVLCTNIVTSTTISSALANTESVALSPVLLSSADIQGDVDLSQSGGMDWIHTNGDVQERKSGVDPLLQMTVCTTPETTTEGIGNSPITFLWNDGTHSKTGSTADMAALYWKKGQTNSVNLSVTEEIGYRITLPAFDYPVVLTLR